MGNVEIMMLSHGRASRSWAEDVTVTRNGYSNEYFVTATVDTAIFDNRAGDYYIDFYTFGNRSFTNSWGRMIPWMYLYN